MSEEARGKASTDDSKVEDPVQGLFSCPYLGCVKLYQLYSSLEKHLSFGKFKLIPEADTLLDKAKTLYQAKLLEGKTSQSTIQGHFNRKESSTAILQEGWALISPKKTVRFNESQKRYLDEKFNLGQLTGHKLDPAIVARDMRYARNKDGTRQFKTNEFLTPQQIQSFFSGKSSKLRHRETEDYVERQNDDLSAAEEQ